LSVPLPISAPAADLEPTQNGAAFRDCPECLELVVIPAARFLMGTTREPQIPTEVPAELSPTAVVIERPFPFGRYEVTRGEYSVFAKATGRAAMRVRCRTWVEEKQGFRDLDMHWDKPKVPAQPTDRHPASCIDWHDAAAYTDWLSERTGARYRLPSEAEWEYAAKAGTRSLWPWGNDPNQACREVNANDRSTQNRYPLG